MDCSSLNRESGASGGVYVRSGAYGYRSPGPNMWQCESQLPGGGRNFGPLLPNTPNIVSRNLTPDGRGRTLGGDSFDKFLQSIRTGTDPDHVHPSCTVTSTTPCLPPPFNGELLQIMPWPVLRHMTEHDLRAIYEYLGAVPCVEGGPGEEAGRCR